MTRKAPHFFIINPIKDRRIEDRFESREPVQIRSEDSEATTAGIATEIGRHGLRLESSFHFDVGGMIQLAFPKSVDNVGCFGRIAWTRPLESGKGFVCGVSVESWHGIIQGPDSWKRLRSVQRRHDRRTKDR